MKKTLVALAVAAVAATSANAAVVYNQDGTKVEVGGSARLTLTKYTDERTDLKDQGSRLVVRGTQDLGEGLSALANLEVRFTKGGNVGNEIHTKRLFAGFNLEDVGMLTFGRQLTVGDEVGLANYTYELNGINKMVDAGDKVVHFRSATWNGFGFGVDYVFGSADKDMVNQNAWVVGAFYAQQFGDVGFKAEAGYSQLKIVDNVHRKAFTVAGELSYGPVAFAVDYSQAKTASIKEKAVLFGLKYQATDATKLYATYELHKVGDLKANAFALGVGHQVHKNVEVFLEGERARIKGGDKGYRTHLGFRVHF
ncbi:porin [Pasteurellaceae bacterium 22721_9_1]